MTLLKTFFPITLIFFITSQYVLANTPCANKVVMVPRFFLATPINHLSLSSLTRAALEKLKISNGRGLLFTPEKELLNGGGFGVKSLSEVNSMLEKMGLRLSQYGALGWTPNEAQLTKLKKMQLSKQQFELLALPIDIFILSVRAENYLKSQKIRYIGELVLLNEPTLLTTVSGPPVFREIKSILEKLKLRFSEYKPRKWKPTQIQLATLKEMYPDRWKSKTFAMLLEDFLSSRSAINNLNEKGVYHLGDLLVINEKALVKIVGIRAFNEIKRKLGQLNLHLRKS